jgi:sulfonate transport system permease protein
MAKPITGRYVLRGPVMVSRALNPSYVRIAFVLRSVSLDGMTIETPTAAVAKPADLPGPRASRPPLQKERTGRPRSQALAASRWLYGIILPVSLALAWEFIVRAGWSEGRLMPPPSRVCEEFYGLWQSGELGQHTGATVTRIAAGFVIGGTAATLLGGIAGYSAVARALIDPSLQALRAVPSLAWVPLFILWLGIFETSKVVLIAVGVFFPVYLGLMGAMLSVDRKIVEVGRIFRLSGLAMIRRILLPAVLPAYVVALRAGLGVGWMFVVAAELMGASEGLGYLLIDGQQLGKPAEIVAAIVAFAVIGKASDWIIVIAAARLLRWEDAFGAMPEQH